MTEVTREQLLKDASGLARQGKLEQAVEKYHAALALSASDWATANLVGDLCARLGKTEAAAGHFADAGQLLADEGFHAKAAAIYKKILRILPDDESARIRTAELAEKQELFADACTHYRAAAALRRARGDVIGAEALEDRARARTADRTDAEPAGVTIEEPVTAPLHAPSAPVEDLDLRWLDGEAPPADPEPCALGEDVFGETEAFTAVRFEPTLDLEGDGWRDLVRSVARPEWLERQDATPAARADCAAPLAADGARVPLSGVVHPRSILPRPETTDVATVFEQIRRAFVEHHATEAGAWLARGRADLEAGDLQPGLAALQRATSAAEVRFEAARVLGQYYLHAGDPAAALGWLERAAEWPVGEPTIAHAVVYDIGCALENMGEPLRALAVFTELNRDAGATCRDVAERIERLSGLS